MSDMIKAVFDAPSSSSESEEEKEEPAPRVRAVGLEAIAREMRGIVDHMRHDPHATMRSRTSRQALTERINGLNIGFCDRERQSEMVQRRAQADVLSAQSAYIIGVLEEIGNGMRERELTKETDLSEFVAGFREIAIAQLRSLKDPDTEAPPLKNIGKDLYIMAGMMVGVLRGDEEFRAGPIGRQVENFVFRNFYVDAESFLMNEAIENTNERQSRKRAAEEETEEERKKQEQEDKRREDEKIEKDIDEQYCALLEQVLFDGPRYYMLAQTMPPEEAFLICKEEAKQKRIDMEAARNRVAISSPPRSVVDPTEVVDIQLVEDEMANLSVRPGTRDLELQLCAALFDGRATNFSEYEPEDMDIDDGEEEEQQQRQPVPSDEITAEEIEAAARAINRGRQQVVPREEPDQQVHIQLRQRDQRECSPGFGDPATSAQRVVSHQNVRQEEEVEPDPQYPNQSPSYGAGGTESPTYGYPSPAYSPASPTYGSPTYGSPSYGSPSYAAEPYDEPAYANDYAASAAAAQAFLQQYPDYSNFVPDHRSRSGSRDGRYAEQQHENGYGQHEPMHDEQMDDDVEVIGVNESRYAHLQPYKQRLTAEEMRAMREASVAVEKKKLESPRELPKIESCGQEEYMEHFLVPLGSDYHDAYKEHRPKVRVNLGKRERTKRIIKVKGLGTVAPVLLTDLHADKIRFPRTPEGKQLQAELVRLQRNRALHPRKKVQFADEKDERNTIRCYIMQAEQQYYKDRGGIFDTTDDGEMKFVQDNQLCWLQDLLRAAEKQSDDRFLCGIATLAGRSVAGSASYEGCMNKDMRWRTGRKQYNYAPLALNTTKNEDPIYTRESALMRRGDDKRPEFQEYTVSHRDYKIILAMKPLENLHIETQWLPELRLYATHAFGCELNREIGTQSAGNSGLSYLVFADTLLDRVNTHRLPQAYFAIHRKPLTLSSSFRVLCNEVPLEKLLNIEHFVFAYGFDEIVFGGEEPWEVAETVVQHCMAVANLVLQTRELLSSSHRCLIDHTFSIMKLPMHGMDARIKPWLKEFNDQLVDVMNDFQRRETMRGNGDWLRFFPVKVLDWENAKIVKKTMDDAQRDRDACYGYYGKYRYNCVDGFMAAMQLHFGSFRIRRPVQEPNIELSEFQARRRQASGLSEKEFKKK